jgi:hypothetical protein
MKLIVAEKNVSRKLEKNLAHWVQWFLCVPPNREYSKLIWDNCNLGFFVPFGLLGRQREFVIVQSQEIFHTLSQSLSARILF